MKSAGPIVSISFVLRVGLSIKSARAHCEDCFCEFRQLGVVQVEVLVLRNQDLANQVKLMQHEASESRRVEEEMARRNSILQSSLQHMVSVLCMSGTCASSACTELASCMMLPLGGRSVRNLALKHNAFQFVLHIGRSNMHACNDIYSTPSGHAHHCLWKAGQEAFFASCW